MYNSQHLSIWYERGKSLGLAVDTIPFAEHEFPRKETIAVLRDTLKVFGQRFFNFFADGFGDQKEFRLEPCHDYPVDYVYNTILKQSANDVEIIRRASMHRIYGSDNMKRALAVGDALAMNALGPAIRHGYVPNSTALTYFQKTAKIRLLPYAPIALVAIPDTATFVERDYLATPHEVGHYIVWHGHHPDGKRMRTKLLETVQDMPKYINYWLEEIFADVYGCLIGGPVMALDFQDIMLDNKLAHFLSGDGIHPVGCVRPYIYTTVLREIGFPIAAQKLEERWSYWLTLRENPTSYKPKGETEAIALTDIRKNMDTVIERILAVLEPIVQEYKNNHALMWSQEISEDADLLQLEGSDQTTGPLYGKFIEYIEKQVPKAIEPDFPELVYDPNDAKRYGVQNGSLTAVRPIGITGLWLDTLIMPDGTQTEIPKAVWAKVLAADGWTSKGPEGDWPFTG